MTKEQFEQEMLKWVLYYKEKLDIAELRRAILPKELVGNSCKITCNPFIQFDEKYFNKKILSNLQGLDSVVSTHPELKSHEITLFIISNPKFKVLNQIINYNQYLVAELKEKVYSPMDIAIAYARHCEALDKLRNTSRR